MQTKFYLSFSEAQPNFDLCKRSKVVRLSEDNTKKIEYFLFGKATGIVNIFHRCFSKGRVSLSKTYAFTRQNLSFCAPKHDLLKRKTSPFASRLQSPYFQPLTILEFSLFPNLFLFIILLHIKYFYHLCYSNYRLQFYSAPIPYDTVYSIQFSQQRLTQNSVTQFIWSHLSSDRYIQ